MRSDLVNSRSWQRYEKFYAYLGNPQKENIAKDVVKKTNVKLKDRFYPS